MGRSTERARYDLSDDWATALKPGFDPWVEIRNGETILRSASLDALPDETAVREHAEWMISFLNGALTVSEKSEPVEFLSVVQFAIGGALNRYITLAPVVIRARVGKIGVTIVIGAKKYRRRPTQRKS